MAIRDESDLETILSSRNRISLDVGAPSIQLEEQVSPADEYAPKIRKAYTITKQRERWSEEEHKKFLEALKLHGRAWRRIEDHVGTKTAVQIRSHAQKFFSKVVRETNNGDETSVKSIEIPPPRPKRKPMHPYPRKLTIPVRNENLAQEKAKSSDSRNLSLSETENQSPTSVLSPRGSDALGMADSRKQSESSSPVSSAVAENSGDLLLSEPSDFILEQRKASPAQAYASSISDNQASVKQELYPQDNDYVEEYPVEASSTQRLKLFGQTVFITDSHISSSLTSSMEFSPKESECAPSPSTIGAPAPFYHVSAPNGSPRPNESVSSSFSTWGFPYASAAFSCTHVLNPIPLKGRALFDDKESDDKETQKEGSSTGSNGESVSAELRGDRNMEIEAQSSRSLVEEAGGRKFPSLFERRANCKRVRGFVPYKRCLAERGTSFSILTGEEREEQRTRLCL